jgi:hypothetical protein
MGRRRDVEPMRRVPSVTVSPVPPSRALQHHPRRCGSPGRQDVATPTAVRPLAYHQPDPRAYARTTTRRKAPTPPPSKPLLDGYRTRHDALPEARFTRRAVYSTALYTIPPHVAETVRHDCNLPPWPIKGGGSPPAARDDRQRTLHAFRPHHDIDTSPQSNLRDLEASPPLPPRL